MTGRWVNTPEPYVNFNATPTGQVPTLFNPQELRSSISIFAGEDELLDIAIQVQGESDAFGWNNDAYLCPDWRNPTKRLVPGRYIVEIMVISSGRKHRDWFRLENDGFFELGQPTPEQRAMLRRRPLA
ncbi:hypothetical protein [Bradyrhizobium stylosanthis]|uniref:hypothetical protein n=1 Tax=Bradyrhizobium stylosanthis TaxID=1803665 RepID=UPI0012E78517|nr:hypothetical protein [Bradyrhizobium stylosanthis]